MQRRGIDMKWTDILKEDAKSGESSRKYHEEFDRLLQELEVNSGILRKIHQFATGWWFAPSAKQIKLLKQNMEYYRKLFDDIDKSLIADETPNSGKNSEE